MKQVLPEFQLSFDHHLKMFNYQIHYELINYSVEKNPFIIIFSMNQDFVT